MRRLLEDIRSLDFRAVVALLLAAFVLVTIQFHGVDFWQKTELVRELAARGDRVSDLVPAQRAYRQYYSQMGWAAGTMLLFGVLPFLTATLVLRMRPSEFGFHGRGFLRHLWVYVAFYLCMAPAIWLASKNPDFRATYPFPHLARNDPSLFWRWELAYFLQFCALEMFFRGFFLFTLERRFGLNAIMVMTIPYAMIHLHKPMPEAFGAIFAGLILGYMALRTRSFYGGILLHYAVALSMDLLATRN